MKNVVITHKDCFDGFTAYWVAIGKLGRTNADYYFMNYNDNPWDLPIEGNNVLVFDFSFKRHIMEAFKLKAHSFRVFDHHKTAMAECEGLDYCTFDLNKSGAMLAWDHFHPEQEPPDLVKYVQDYDLWTFKLEKSKEVNAAIMSYEKTWENWDMLASRVQYAKNLMIELGEVALRKEKIADDIILEKATTMVVDGSRVPMVNTCLPGNSALDKLRTGHPFAAAYYFKPNGAIKVSLRSTDAGRDVSEVAKKYGGGGHRNAASFDCEMVQFMEFHSTVEPLQ